MRKFLTIAGKCLIVLALLWPMPMSFLVDFLGGYRIGIPEGGVLARYWWPLLLIVAIGILMCFFADYHSPSINPQPKNTHAILRTIFKFFGYGLLGVLGFFLLVLLIVGLYYTFFTPLIEVIAPIAMGALAVGYLIYLGYKYYKNKRNEQ